MSNPGIFSSLSELIDNHFTNGKNDYKLISLKKNFLDTEIENVLSLQLKNMFKKKEEMATMEEKIKNTDSNMLIDLNTCIEKNKISFETTDDKDSNILDDYMETNEIPFNNTIVEDSNILDDYMETNEIPFNNAIIEDLNILDDYMETNEIPFNNNIVEEEIKDTDTIIKNILKHKLGKPTPFARILCSRYKHNITSRHVHQSIYHVNPNIKIFDFSTSSPDDINKESLRKHKYPTSPRTLMNKINKKKLIKK